MAHFRRSGFIAMADSLSVLWPAPISIRNTATSMCSKGFPVAAVLRIKSRGETRLARPRGFGVATDVAGPLRMPTKRAEPCPAWGSDKRCGVAAKSGEGERAAAGVGREARGAMRLVRATVCVKRTRHQGPLSAFGMAAMRQQNPNGADDPERAAVPSETQR